MLETDKHCFHRLLSSKNPNYFFLGPEI